MDTKRLLLVVLVAVSMSACAGLEVGGRAGIYRVDEKQDSSSTQAKYTVPFKCLFVDCQRNREEIQGS